MLTYLFKERKSMSHAISARVKQKKADRSSSLEELNADTVASPKS